MYQQSHAPPRARVPIGAIVALAILALLIVAGLVAIFWNEWRQFSAAYPLVADLLRFILFAAPVSIVAGAGVLALQIAYRRYGAIESVKADKVIALTRAQVQIAPHATSFNYHIESVPPAMLALPDPVSAPPLAIPTFATMLDQHLVGAGRKLVLGYDEGGVLEGDWTDLYSTAVAGMPGQGKTTSQRFFACQTALHGARFAVIDPHAGAGEDSLAATLAPLGNSFLCPIASDNKEMLDTVRHIADIGAQRVKGFDKDETPIILWVDELTALLGRSTIGDELAELLERIAQEYRKKHVFVSASGQIWTASRATSELRDSFASVLCHRMKRGQARMLLPTDEAHLVERLSPGRAVLWRTSGATSIVGIPNTTEADVKRVATLISGGATVDMRSMGGSVPVTTKSGMGFHPPPKIDQKSTTASTVHTQAASAQTLSAESLRAHALFLSGKDLTEIVLELRKVKPKEGARYQLALKEIQSLIRLAIQGGMK